MSVIMFDLVEIIAGHSAVVDSFIMYWDCSAALEQAMYLSDGMATYVCEVSL